jgi:hypothetical protein
MDRHARGWRHPLAPGRGRSQARRPPERRLQANQDRRRPGDGLPSRPVPLQPRRQAARFVERQPVADGLAGDAPHLGDTLAAVGWPTGQERAPRPPWWLATMMCLRSSLRESLRILGNDQDGFAHRLLS